MSNPLDLDQDWKIGEASFSAITKKIIACGAKTILEFGAGTSSIRLAQEFPHVKVISIDHDQIYYNEAKNLQELFGLTNLELRLNPLKWQMHGLAFFHSYAPVAMNQEIDVVIIDGPPYSTFRGREACFYQVFENIPIGGVVILDDYARSGEKEFVNNWLARYPGCFCIKELRIGHHLCLLEKVKHRKMGRNVGIVIQNHVSLFRWVLKRILNRFKTTVKKILFEKHGADKKTQ